MSGMLGHMCYVHMNARMGHVVTQCGTYEACGTHMWGILGMQDRLGATHVRTQLLGHMCAHICTHVRAHACPVRSSQRHVGGDARFNIYLSVCLFVSLYMASPYTHTHTHMKITARGCPLGEFDTPLPACHIRTQIGCVGTHVGHMQTHMGHV